MTETDPSLYWLKFLWTLRSVLAFMVVAAVGATTAVLLGRSEPLNAAFFRYVVLPVSLVAVSVWAFWLLVLARLSQIELQHLGAPYVAVFLLAAVTAGYGVRMLSSGDEQRRRFLVSAIVFSLALITTGSTLAVAVDRNLAPLAGTVSLLTSEGVEEATLSMTVQRTTVATAPVFDPNAPSESLNLEGFPHIEVKVRGEPGSEVEVALGLSGTMAMTYRLSSTSTEIRPLLMEPDDGWLDGPLRLVGSTRTDTMSPLLDDIVSFYIDDEDSWLIRRHVTIADSGIARITLTGTEPKVWAVASGDSIEVRYPTLSADAQIPQTNAESERYCYVGTGSLNGEWVPPTTTILEVDDPYRKWPYRVSPVTADHYPAEQYWEGSGRWIQASGNDAQLVRNEWRGSNSLAAAQSMQDEGAAIRNLLAVFVASTLGAVAIGVLVDAAFHWPPAAPKPTPRFSSFEGHERLSPTRRRGAAESAIDRQGKPRP